MTASSVEEGVEETPVVAVMILSDRDDATLSDIYLRIIRGVSNIIIGNYSVTCKPEFHMLKRESDCPYAVSFTISSIRGDRDVTCRYFTKSFELEALDEDAFALIRDILGLHGIQGIELTKETHLTMRRAAANRSLIGGLQFEEESGSGCHYDHFDYFKINKRDVCVNKTTHQMFILDRRTDDSSIRDFLASFAAVTPRSDPLLGQE